VRARAREQAIGGGAAVRGDRRIESEDAKHLPYGLVHWRTGTARLGVKLDVG
jgi:hypothetical protein